nr:DUF4277 domain-containing protein [Paraglaciecola psychrophila]
MLLNGLGFTERTLQMCSDFLMINRSPVRLAKGLMHHIYQATHNNLTNYQDELRFN